MLPQRCPRGPAVATEKVELTKLRLDNLRPAPRGQRYELADTHVSGLRVRVGDAAVEVGKHRGKASQISFVLLARFPSKPNPNPTRRTLGNYSREFSQLTLEAARRKALHWKAMISAGSDPAEVAKQERAACEEARRAAAEAQRNRRSVGDALEAYAQDRLAQLRRGNATRRALEGKCGLLNDLLSREVCSITRQDLADAVRKRAQGAPVSANRQLAYAHAFFNWCVDEDLTERNPAARVRKPTREVSRDRYHSLDELAEIWRAAGTLGYPFGPLYRLLIALPMRREELAGLLVSELDLGPEGSTEGVWTLPASRTKRANALRVPITPLARTIIVEALKDPLRPTAANVEDAPEEHLQVENTGSPKTPNIRPKPKKVDFVFTTTGETVVSGFAKAKRRLDLAIEKAREGLAVECDMQTVPMPHWTVHDLRTTFNTHACEQLRIDAAVADRILNHVATATTSKIMRIYNRSELFEQRRSALAAWEGLLATSVLGKPDDKIVSMKRAANS